MPNWRHAAVLDVTGIGDNDYGVIASFAFLHRSGLNLTTTYGKSNTDTHCHRIKMGYLPQRFDIGPTAFSVEYCENADRLASGG